MVGSLFLSTSAAFHSWPAFLTFVHCFQLLGDASRARLKWHARCQAFEAAQFEKEWEDAEQARLDVFASGFTLGTYFCEYVGEDLKRQWEGAQINPETGEEEPYKKPNSFSIDQKLKILNWAYDMPVKNAVERKSVLLEIGAKAVKDTAFDEAFDEI